MRRLLTLLTALMLSTSSLAEPITSHGYAQFGDLKYGRTFTHFDWVNPEAPKGGTVRLMAYGTFDTLNPYSIKGTSPVASGNFAQYGINELSETLMAGSGLYDPSGDEPNASYGLIAQSVQYAADRSWVVFNLRPEARFHDGRPITAYDVRFSYRTLLAQGHPLYRTSLQEVARVEILGRLKIRFVFKRSGNPLLILRLGEMPVLPQHYWQQHDFTATTFEPPLNSGPYRIVQVVPGKRLVFEKVKDWWGLSLPVNRGKYNFQRVEVEFYRDNDVAFEAFKAGEFDFYIDNQAKNWANNYGFPAVRRGDVVRAEIPHQIPIQTQALFFNSRRTQFRSPEVRQALGLLFDFEWTNQALFNGAYQRATSYYPNSEFASRGLPEGLELKLLEAHREQLPPALFEQPFQLGTTDGRGIPRDTLRRALGLLQQAGWHLNSTNQLVDAQGKPFSFEILLANSGLERILQAYRQNLKAVGIETRMRTVDRAQYKQRMDRFDFDLALMTLPQTLSPGLEQWSYFHSSQALVKGGKNYAGIHNPVVDQLLEQLLAAQSREQQIAATRALDRVLLWNHYTIPNWYSSRHRLAYRNRFAHVTTPPYTLGLRAWWIKDLESTR